MSFGPVKSIHQQYQEARKERHLAAAESQRSISPTLTPSILEGSPYLKYNTACDIGMRKGHRYMCTGSVLPYLVWTQAVQQSEQPRIACWTLCYAHTRECGVPDFQRMYIGPGPVLECQASNCSATGNLLSCDTRPRVAGGLAEVSTFCQFHANRASLLPVLQRQQNAPHVRRDSNSSIHSTPSTPTPRSESYEQGPLLIHCGQCNVDRNLQAYAVGAKDGIEQTIVCPKHGHDFRPPAPGHEEVSRPGSRERQQEQIPGIVKQCLWCADSRTAFYFVRRRCGTVESWPLCNAHKSSLHAALDSPEPHQFHPRCVWCPLNVRDRWGKYEATL